MLLRNSFFLLIATVIFSNCTPSYNKYIAGYSGITVATQPDYSREDYWAALPSKKDPSDSVPLPLQKTYKADTTVDVFFLHPTTLTAKDDSCWNANLSDPAINAKTDYSTILYQASVFNEYNVYAPRYRQAHIKSYYTTDTASALAAFEKAYQDIKSAFTYYLQHYNNGKPVIIAAHSQGSTHAQRLLKEFFEKQPLQKQLVAAYVIGMYIPNNYFTQLPLCKDSLSTGCVLGWRTFKKGYYPDYVIKENNSAWAVNPLSWQADTVFVNKSFNKGAVLKNFNKVNRKVAGASVSNGVLWIDKLNVPGAFLLKMKNFHIGDINIFYLNIRENLRQRVKAYKNRT